MDEPRLVQLRLLGGCARANLVHVGIRHAHGADPGVGGELEALPLGCSLVDKEQMHFAPIHPAPGSPPPPPFQRNGVIRAYESSQIGAELSRVGYLQHSDITRGGFVSRTRCGAVQCSAVRSVCRQTVSERPCPPPLTRDGEREPTPLLDGSLGVLLDLQAQRFAQLVRVVESLDDKLTCTSIHITSHHGVGDVGVGLSSGFFNFF